MRDADEFFIFLNVRNAAVRISVQAVDDQRSVSLKTKETERDVAMVLFLKIPTRDYY